VTRQEVQSVQPLSSTIAATTTAYHHQPHKAAKKGRSNVDPTNFQYQAEEEEEEESMKGNHHGAYAKIESFNKKDDDPYALANDEMRRARNTPEAITNTRNAEVLNDLHLPRNGGGGGGGGGGDNGAIPGNDDQARRARIEARYNRRTLKGDTQPSPPRHSGGGHRARYDGDGGGGDERRQQQRNQQSVASTLHHHGNDEVVRVRSRYDGEEVEEKERGQGSNQRKYFHDHQTETFEKVPRHHEVKKSKDTHDDDGRHSVDLPHEGGRRSKEGSRHGRSPPPLHEAEVGAKPIGWRPPGAVALPGMRMV
jgi:hypothetical protein